MIHTLLSSGGYRITADSGMLIDSETSLVSRRQTAVFRGSLSSLFSTFEFGTSGEAPDGQNRLYCSGPQNIKQVDGTGTDPHWQFDLEYVGLHSYVHGSRYSVFRVAPLWTVRETTLPYSKDYNGVSYTIIAGTPYRPTGSDAETPVTIHDYLPGANIRGILYTAIHPHPSHPYITALLSTMPTIITSAMITANTVDYGGLTDSGYNWCKGMTTGSTTSKNTVGKWFVGDIQADRLFEPMDGTTANKIYQVTFPVRWLQRKIIA